MFIALRLNASKSLRRSDMFQKITTNTFRSYGAYPLFSVRVYKHFVPDGTPLRNQVPVAARPRKSCDRS